ncbi:glycosyltransferase [Pseudooceanicola sp. CBS1P-1]|uniref:Glycosyltransferase n=2 Tax=Paracoccaceae TaxID=31989 RepID=A0A6L7G5T0_9RHOB|nr:glycosyltransferase [Pseudooceanicola endophyticus]MXN18023.1 glycosyltransferase [Pseudooceanicola albus]
MTETDKRSEIIFDSVDSNPRRFAVAVPQWKAPATLVSFVLIAWGLLWLRGLPGMDRVFTGHDFLLTDYAGSHSIAVRIFVLAFFLAFSLFATASFLGRLMFLVDLLVTYALLCAVLDLANGVIATFGGIRYPMALTEIASGIFGFALFAFKLLERGQMPSRIQMVYRPGRTGPALVRLIVTLALAAAGACWVAALDLPLVHWLRAVSLLGGIGPGVFLFLPLFFVQIYLLGRWDDWRVQRRRIRDPFTPPLSIIVPAYNEEYIIARTIEAIDVAASNYAGPVHVLILDNNSSDRTGQIARDALAACRAATGEVLHIPTPGKSHALNAGLAAVQTEFLIRVDADTQLGRDNLARAMQYFRDPGVGCVGGMPMPPGGGPFDSARLLEVMVKHGFYSVGFTAINCVVGIPGMFVCYRTAHPRELGGFVEGMNGEDTDISLRIGEMGYLSVVDPNIRYISEVPTTYRHMREQRIRWFRSVYHISARCRDLIYSPWPTLRGKLLLPFMLVNSGRRTMLLPLFLFGLIEHFGQFNPVRPVLWSAILALLIGAPALMAIFAACANGRPGAIRAMGPYLLFRFLRAYFTLESMLSIRITPRREDLARAYLKNIVPRKPLRVA